MSESELDTVLGGPPPIDDEALPPVPPVVPVPPVGETTSESQVGKASGDTAVTLLASDAELITPLRLLNVHVQHLWSQLETVRSGALSLPSVAVQIGSVAGSITQIVDRLTASIRAGTIDKRADAVARVVHAWETIAASPVVSGQPDGGLDAHEQLNQIGLLEGQCRTIIYWTVYLTATARLKEWLGTLRPGYAIAFDDIFGDELPFAEERARLRNVIAASPQMLAPVGGMVDRESGLVYCYDTDPARRRGSVLTVALTLAATVVVAALLGLIPVLAAVSGPAGVAGGWVAALAGVVVHLAVTVAKRQRGGGSATALPVDRLSIEVSARLGSILLRLGMLLVVYLGLLAGGLITYDAAAPAGFLFSAFLVGYSLDSFVDLFSAGLDQQAAARQSGIKSQLGM